MCRHYIYGMAALLLCGCSGGPSLTDKKPTMPVTSTAFKEGEEIPKEYTADGAGVSPPLAWSGAPKGVKSFALICDDPDAPGKTWTHWLVWNLPPDTKDLPEHVLTEKMLPNGALQGTNDAVGIGYGGPGPPKGKPHRYFFKVYALDTVLELKEGAKRPDVDSAIKGHVLAWGQLMGTYERK